jgi:hypothetical protein
MEGTVPVPTSPRALMALMMYCPEYHLWGSYSSGGETPMSVQMTLEKILQSVFIQHWET